MLTNLLIFTVLLISPKYLHTGKEIIILSMFSLAGIPPLAGFWGKLLIITSTFWHQSLWAVIVIVLLSILTGIYYLRIVKRIISVSVVTEPKINLRESIILAWISL